MNKKIVTSVFLICILFFCIATNYKIEAKSPEKITFPLGLNVYSPIDKTYSNPILCNISFYCGLGVQCSLNYSIDGEYQDIIRMHFPAVLAFDKNYVLLASFFLPELPAGKHSIDFGIEERLYNYSGELPSDIPFQRYTTEGFLYPNYVASWVNTVHFTVDSSDSVFNITMLSIDNRTYNTMNIPLNFSIDKPAEWIAYTLDGKENVTIYGNTTLRDLPNGLHNLTIYAEDKYGNVGTSQTVIFMVLSSNTVGITVAIITVTAIACIGIGAGIIINRKKIEIILARFLAHILKMTKFINKNM